MHGVKFPVRLNPMNIFFHGRVVSGKSMLRRLLFYELRLRMGMQDRIRYEC